MSQSQRSAWQRLWAVLLSFFMVTGGVPVPALAEEVAEQPAAEVATAQEEATEDTVAVEEAAEQVTEQVVAQQESAEAPLVASADEVKDLAIRVTITVVKDDGTLDVWLPETSVTVKEGASAWTAIQPALELLAENGGASNTSDESWGVSINSITSVDGKTLEYDPATGAYWQFLVNDAYSNLGVSNYLVKAGDRLELRYAANGSAANPAEVEPDDLSKEPENLSAAWPTFENNGNVTTTTTPTDVSANWRTLVGYVTEPLIVGGKVYVATSSLGMGNSNKFDHQLELLRIDETTGQIEASTPLAGTISYTSRPTYHNGLIYVALDGGRVQAINVSTMKTRWVSAAPESGGQAQTSLKVIEGVAWETQGYDYATKESYTVQNLRDILFSGTVVYDSDYNVTAGTMSAYDATTGDLIPDWTFVNTGAGFSWTNVAKVGSYVLMGDTAGTLRAISPSPFGYASVVSGDISLGASINADLALYNNNVVVPTRDGVLHVVSVAGDGTLTQVGSKKILSGCKAGATIVGNKAIVAGLNEAGDGSAVVVVNLDTLAVEQTIATADGAVLPGNSLYFISAPVLVSQQDGKNICYFTMNYGENDNGTYLSGGNVYWFELGASEAHLLYEPTGAAINVSDSPLVVDETGALYYLNDSGYLTRLTPNISAEDKAPQLALDSVAAGIMSRDATATLTFEQEIPADATSIRLWAELPDVLEFVGTEASVTVGDQMVATATVDGQRVEVLIEGADAVALRPTSAATAQALTAQANATPQTVAFTFQAKVRADADLSAYENNGVYVVPVTANTQFNEDEGRTYAQTKSLKIAKASEETKDGTKPKTSNAPASKPADKGNKSTLAKTGDQTISVVAFVVVALVVVGAGIALRLRHRKDA